MALIDVANFERFFRLAAGLDVDKEDLRRYGDFVSQNIYELLLRGETVAKANARETIEPFDLPITKGLQECIHRFREMDQEAELTPVLNGLVAHPPLDLATSEKTEARLPGIAGGLGLALARTFKVIDPDLKNPQTEHWERGIALFDLLL